MARVPSWVRPYIGIPWLDLGRTREGCDCWGLVRLAMKGQFNIDLPLYDTGYERADKENLPAIVGIIARELPHYREIATADPNTGLMPLGTEMPGDVLLLRQRGVNGHLGLVVARYTMLHIEEGVDSCIEDYADKAWRRRLVGCYRYV